MKVYSIAIHGGAGTILREEMTPGAERSYRDGLEKALDAGYSVLEGGGSSLEAVHASVMVLEDNELFNAGKGSVFTNEGLQEMDASIMEGKGLMAGAVAGIRNIRNPIDLALQVMQHSDHVFLCGQGASEFAKHRGIKMEADEYFFSQFRHDQWKSVSGTNQFALDHNIPAGDKEKKFGTVGAVACDAMGNIAAATSTGGMTNKRFGRVGDSPMIGAGTYANNRTCAISATGHGEPFIRAVAAYDVSCLMEYRGLDLEAAMEHVVNKKLVEMEGEGGMIGVDANGNVSMLFNSAGMYRAMRNSSGRKEVSIYR